MGRWRSFTRWFIRGRRRPDNITKRLALRRQYFGAHSLRSQRYALLLAKQLRLPEEERSALSLAGYVYDAGRLQVPDEVLLQRGPLDGHQQEAMKAHVFHGCSLLRESELLRGLASPLLEAVYDVTLFHHERYDGSGYPYGLKGEAIPRLARLMAVADAFSAMTAQRPYRQALSPIAALEEIERGLGSQFDPELAETFVRTMERMIASDEGDDWSGA